MSSPAERWYAQIDESRFRNASDDSPAPLREPPHPYDEPDDISSYAGPHALREGQRIDICMCGWHPWNHPGFTVADHLKDWINE